MKFRAYGFMPKHLTPPFSLASSVLASSVVEGCSAHGFNHFYVHDIHYHWRSLYIGGGTVNDATANQITYGCPSSAGLCRYSKGARR